MADMYGPGVQQGFTFNRLHQIAVLPKLQHFGRSTEISSHFLRLPTALPTLEKKLTNFIWPVEHIGNIKI